MISRDEYLRKILNFKDSKEVKILTGMRRVGKSTIMKLYINELKNQGVSKENIIYMNFDSLKFEEYTNYKELYKYLSSKITENNQSYILLDEIQEVEFWEKTIRSLLEDFENVDIYITGSNAKLLSSELATLLSGRYVEINILPLSFKEFIQFDKEINNIDYDKIAIEDKFQEYLKYGSLPVIFNYKNKEDIFENLILGIYNTVLIKDIFKRNQIKNTVLFENIIHYMFDNIGNVTSSKNVSKYIKNENIDTTSATVLNYLKMLSDAYILYPAKRYDIKGKKLLKTLSKYYITDIGMRNAILGFKNIDYGHILENIVYLELLRRDYRVNIGKINNLEIDFIATNSKEKIYYQVSQSILDKKTLNREIKPLKKVEDNYKKVIITNDKTFVEDIEGIEIINIIDFLLER